MYKVTIGLEVHCELESNTKNFSPAPNGYTNFPNEHVATVDLGLPGILPVPNKFACRQALLTAQALNCENPNEVIFDRKNYFYADLPKGYQITQNTKPMGINGYLDIMVDGKVKRVDIHDLHLEEDTASLDHNTGYSLIDYNRSGVPLMEIVTEPCMHSADEAVAFLEDLRDVFLYLGVSEARSDKGEMRCDVNISLNKEGDSRLGTKVEMKNINAFYNVRAAIEYEIKRQSKLLDEGEKVVQETRRIADDGKTYPMRKKVDAIDYKYFIEPNIPSTPLSKEYLDEIRSTLPVLKLDRYLKYIELGLTDEDAKTLSKNRKISDYFEEVIKNSDVLVATQFMTTSILSTLNKLEIDIDELFIKPDMLSVLVDKVKNNEMSLDQAKKLLYKVIDEKKDPRELIEKENLHQINDDDELTKIINDLMDNNPEQMRQYIEEDNKAIVNFFIGQTMKTTNRQANPNKSLEIIKRELERRKNDGK